MQRKSKPWKVDDPRREKLRARGTNKHLQNFWVNATPEQKRLIWDKKAKKHTEESCQKMRGPRPAIQGSKHVGAVEVKIGNLHFVTKKEAMKSLNISEGFLNGIIAGTSQYFLIEGKIFRSKRQICKFYKVPQTIVEEYLIGNIQNLTKPKCNICGVECSNYYLFNRWHKDCTKELKN